MATIQSLPEELLLVIILLVQRRGRQSHSTHPLSRSRSMLRALLRLSLVCKNWREATLKYGVLWASVTVDTSRGDCLTVTLAMLERSKDAELELSMCLRTGDDEQAGGVVTSILNHRARVTSLHLTADIFFTLEGDVPVPETMAHALTTTNYSTPPILSNGLASLFRGLGKLSLSLPSSSTAVRISDLLDIVKNSQGLESLSLTSFLFIKEGRQPTCVVHPPRLRRLFLRDCDSATILSRLEMPKVAVINIVLKDRRVRGYHPLHGAHILCALPHLLSSVCALKETTNLILEEDEEGRYFGLGLSPFRSPGSSVVVKNRSFSLEKFIQRSLRAISCHSYFELIESFTFSCSSPVPLSWPMVLSRFGALLELNTSTIHGADVLYTLMQTALDGTPLCLSLRRIRFFERLPYLRHFRVDPQLLTTFHNFRTESRCSAVRITLRYLDGRKEEL